MLSWIIFVSIITAILWWLGGILNIDQHKPLFKRELNLKMNNPISEWLSLVKSAGLKFLSQSGSQVQILPPIP